MEAEKRSFWRVDRPKVATIPTTTGEQNDPLLLQKKKNLTLPIPNPLNTSIWNASKEPSEDQYVKVTFFLTKITSFLFLTDPQSSRMTRILSLAPDPLLWHLILQLRP